MPDAKTITDKQEEGLNRAQVLFSANPLFIAPQGKQYFQAQQTLFDLMKRFTTAWFARRQEAAESMIEAGRCISVDGKGDLSCAIKAMADWHTDEMKRLATDAQACTEMIQACATSLSTQEVEAVTEMVTTARRGQKATASTPL